VPDDGLLWRKVDGEWEPMPQDSQWGTWSTSNEHTTINTVTDESGTVAIKRSTDPGWWESLQYGLQNTLNNISLPF
jgi:hypothetical protein